MICEKTVKRFCKDDISLIENYDKAIADTKQVWHCHHRRETIYSRSGLIEIGEYYNRPACELIFLTKSEHIKLHHLGKPLSEDTRRKLSEANKGKPSWMKGKHHSEESCKKMSESKKGKHLSAESRKKISEAKKGENNPNFGKPAWNNGKHLSAETRKKISEAHNGKHHSEETRQKLSEALKGKHHLEEAKKKISEANKGKNNWTKGTHWYNNGVKCIKAKTCPEGFVLGRLKCA